MHYICVSVCSEHVCRVCYSAMTYVHIPACISACMCVSVHMCICSDTTVSLAMTGDLLYLRLPVFHASVTAEVFISSLAEPEPTDSHALAPAECPLAWFLSVAVGMGCVLVFGGWDIACYVLAALPGAARLGAVCESSASIRSGWHSAYRFPSP